MLGEAWVAYLVAFLAMGGCGAAILIWAAIVRRGGSIGE